MTSSLTISSGALAVLLRDVHRASGSDDALPMIAGVMLHTAADDKGRTVLAATATDRFVALHGHIPAASTLPASIWLTNDQVRQVLGVMRLYTSRKRAVSSETEIVLDDGRVTFRQIALDGLADISVTFTHLATPGGGFPKVDAILRKELAREPSAATWFVDGAKLGMLTSIASSRGEHLRCRSAGGTAPVIAQIGDSLVGLLMPVRVDSERQNALDVPVYGLPVLTEQVAA